MKDPLIKLLLCFLLIYDVNSQQPPPPGTTLQVLIRTPFGHTLKDAFGNDIYMNVSAQTWDQTWDQEQIDNCLETYLFRGGIYKNVDQSFIKKTDYTNNPNSQNIHEVKCFFIEGNNIYTGTSSGIQYSSDYGESWASFPNITDKVNAISKIGNTILAGTDNGVLKTTNSGFSWNRYLTGKVVKCMNKTTSYIYVGTNDDIYLDDGNWSDMNVNGLNSSSINSIYINGSEIYVCTNQGLFKSINEGGDWLKLGSPVSNARFTAIIKYIPQSGSPTIYAGVQDVGGTNLGCYYSINDGNNWSLKSTISFPVYKNTSIKQKINCFAIRVEGSDPKIYAATDCELIYSSLGTASWSERDVIGNLITTQDYNVSQIATNNEDIWASIDGYKLYNNVEPVFYYNGGPDGKTYTATPYNWPEFNCHQFAWHLQEGGVSCTGGVMNPPEDHGYVPIVVNTINWDYIQGTPGDDNNPPNWDKVEFSTGHSVTATQPFESDKCISKWGKDGPLVKHSLLNDHLYEGVSPVKYWTSKKIIKNDNPDPNIPKTIGTDQWIGRIIETSGLIDINPNSHVLFYVANMSSHGIDLKPGFHAKNGSYFNAYVQTLYSSPWEEYLFKRSITLHDSNDISYLQKSKIILAQDNEEATLQVQISPNPSSDKITLMTKSEFSSSQFPVSVSFYTLNGKLIKTLSIHNGVETLINTDNLDSGAYLVSAEAQIIDKNENHVKLADSEIIIIKK